MRKWHIFQAVNGAFVASGCECGVVMASSPYGDSDFDLFAAQVPSPLFQRTRTAYGDSDFDVFAAQLPSLLFQQLGAAYLGVLDAREYEAAALETTALESPGMPPVRITGHRPYHSRVILSSSSSSEHASSLFTKSPSIDPCNVCGEEDGVLLVCKGRGGCSASVHENCLRSRQV